MESCELNVLGASSNSFDPTEIFYLQEKKREEGKLEYVIFIGGCCKLLFRQRFLQIPPVSDS